MRTKAARQPLTPPAQTYAQLEFIHATAFCTWLAEHVHRPTELGQDDLDRYYTALKIGHRQALRGFLNWAMTSHNLPTLTFTRPRFTTGEALTQTRRIDLLRRLITDHDDDGDDRPLRMRVAACVLLLYAQPVTRIMTLTIDDIAVDDDGMTLQLGDPPAPVPEPFAALVRRLLAQRPASPAAGCSPAAGPASRSATSPSAKASAISVSRSGSPASPPSASSPYKHPPRSSPKHSGSTTPPPTARPSTPAGSGTATPPPTRPRREPSREHAANEYAALPVAGGPPWKSRVNAAGRALLTLVASGPASVTVTG